MAKSVSKINVKQTRRGIEVTYKRPELTLSYVLPSYAALARLNTLLEKSLAKRSKA